MSHSAASLDVTWQRPTFLLPLFNVCVLLASTGSLTLAISTALVLMVTTVISSLLIVVLTRLTNQSPAALVWLLCAASITAVLELLLHAWFYSLYQQLGLFLPMTMISSLLLARQELQPQHRSLTLAMKRALSMSLGYALAAVVLGAGRELVGHGSLFCEASDLWGPWAEILEIQLFRVDMGFFLALLAPGAFIALGLGVALYNWLLLRLRKHKDQTKP
jgi:electron transport complex protein RnfE